MFEYLKLSKEFGVKFFKYVVLTGLVYFPLFSYLDTLPIRIWDESRLAMNAYEMFKYGDYLVTHFEGKPDLWNTKPPLLIWLQVMSMKTFGVNVLAIRLPSAIAALFTAAVLMVFSIRYLKNYWFGFIAVMVLITSHGYVNVHSTRTGDYDALLTLFTTLFGLSFFAYLETKRTLYLYYFFLFCALAVLTKSITGLVFIPALVIYSVWHKQVVVLLKNKHFYLGLLGFLLLVVGYYGLRELYNPGYLKAVQENELGGRYLSALEAHKEDFWFYYTNFINYQFSYWHLFIPCGMLIGATSKNRNLKRISFFSSLMIFTFLIVISSAQTKLEWYDVPLYPYLALLATVFLYFIFDLLKNIPLTRLNLSYNVLPYIFLLFLMIPPYTSIVNKTYKPQEHPWDKDFYDISYHLKDAVKGHQDLDGYFMVYDGYKAHLDMYIHLLHEKNIDFDFKDWKQLDSGDRVIACQSEVIDFIENQYHYELLYHNGTIKKYHIHGRK
jgi:4-amino-4-deoxy-L-arabinose transferase-like glycosyltransferase